MSEKRKRGGANRHERYNEGVSRSFTLQAGCHSVPWQGEVLWPDMAIRFGPNRFHPIKEISPEDFIAIVASLRRRTDIVGLPLYCALIDETMKVYPTPNRDYIVVDFPEALKSERSPS